MSGFPHRRPVVVSTTVRGQQLRKDHHVEQPRTADQRAPRAAELFPGFGPQQPCTQSSQNGQPVSTQPYGSQANRSPNYGTLYTQVDYGQ